MFTHVTSLQNCLALAFLCWTLLYPVHFCSFDYGNDLPFQTQYESWVDADINHLSDVTERKLPSAQVEKAMASLNGSFLGFELAPTENGANRIDVGMPQASNESLFTPPLWLSWRLSIRKNRFMQIVKKIHGELMIGDVGSFLVELAACWTVVLTLTGLYLWWPRNHSDWRGFCIHAGNLGQNLLARSA